jgi:hypothetical protein
MIGGNHTRVPYIGCLGAIGIVAVILYATSPLTGDFWWSDAPRHALNGIFVKDLIAAHPFAHPQAYAANYYLQYPALTILFYPPLFYAVSAGFFALLGDSHAVAQSVVAVYYFALGCGVFALGRLWLRPLSALAAAIVLMVLPDMALWGRQVMLEIPMLACASWSAWFLLRFGRTGRFSLLIGAVLLFLAAIYTKQTVAFTVPAMGWYLIRSRGWALLRQRRAWLTAGLALVALIPLVFLTLKFGGANIQSVVGVADTPASRFSLENWVWYAVRLPQMTGWVPLVMAALFVALRLAGRSQTIARRDFEFLLLWFLGGYILLSVVSLKETRHATLLLVPVALWIGALLDGIMADGPRRAAATLVAGGCLAFVLAFCPVPFVSGYRQAAQWVAKAAPPNSVIVFSGKRDGSFIFAMRTATGRHDLWTLRSDKLLLDIAVRRQLGVRERHLSEAQIRALLQRLNVQYIVAQRDFWTDLPEMRRFQDVLDSASFREVARLPVRANVPVEDKQIRIYRSLLPPAPPGAHITIGLPIIGRSLSGAVGK